MQSRCGVAMSKLQITFALIAGFLMCGVLPYTIGRAETMEVLQRHQEVTRMGKLMAAMPGCSSGRYRCMGLNGTIFMEAWQ